MRKSKITFTEEEKAEFKKIILKETYEALVDSDYKEFESLYAHLNHRERIEEVIYKAIEKAIDKAQDVELGIAARYAKTANENRIEDRAAKRGRPKEHKSGRQISIWLEQDQIDKIQTLADREDATFSKMAAGIIEAALDEIEAENKSFFQQ